MHTTLSSGVPQNVISTLSPFFPGEQPGTTSDTPQRSHVWRRLHLEVGFAATRQRREKQLSGVPRTHLRNESAEFAHDPPNVLRGRFQLRNALSILLNVGIGGSCLQCPILAA